MGIKSKYTVKSIDSFQCNEWLLYKHYAKRIPGSIMFSFGLYDSDTLVGIITYGMSPNSKMNEIGGMRILELNRLCINDGCLKNSASYFISQTYKYLQNYILLSYSDAIQGHHGYIYQACNWIYTGVSKGGEILETENGLVHKRAYDQRTIKSKIISSSRGEKHRYFYVPNMDKKIINAITTRFPLQPYPKGKNKRYDSSYNPTVQTSLF